MRTAPNATTPDVPSCHQLPLPLDPSAVPSLAQPRVVEVELSLRPAAIWVGLPLPLRAQIRQTFRRVCEELVHDGQHR